MVYLIYKLVSIGDLKEIKSAFNQYLTYLNSVSLPKKNLILNLNFYQCSIKVYLFNIIVKSLHTLKLYPSVFLTFKLKKHTLHIQNIINMYVLIKLAKKNRISVFLNLFSMFKFLSTSYMQ